MSMRKLNELQDRVAHLKRQSDTAFDLLFHNHETKQIEKDRVKHYRHVHAEYKQAQRDLSKYKRAMRRE